MRRMLIPIVTIFFTFLFGTFAYSGFNDKDLAGHWHMSGLFTGQCESGALILDANGNGINTITPCEGTTYESPYSLNVTRSGKITREERSTWKGSISPKKNFVASIRSHNDEAVFSLFARRGEQYAQKDLTGEWYTTEISYNTYENANVLHGTMIVDQAGNASGFVYKEDGSLHDHDSFMLGINENGKLIGDDVPVDIFMDSSKQIMISSGLEDDTIDDEFYENFRTSFLIIIKKGEEDYQQSDLVGAWYLYAIDKGFMNAEYAFLEIDADGSGDFIGMETNGDTNVSDSERYPSFAITSEGVVSIEGESSFTGYMNADKTLITFVDGKALGILIKADPALEVVGSIATQDPAYDVAVGDGKAFLLSMSPPGVSFGRYNTSKFDISNPSSPSLLATTSDYSGRRCFLEGDTLYVAGRPSLDLDLLRTTNLTRIEVKETIGQSRAVHVADGYAYVASRAHLGEDGSITIIDLESGETFTHNDSEVLAENIFVLIDKAFIIDKSGELFIFEVSDLLDSENAEPLDYFFLSDSTFNSISASGDYVYITGSDNITGRGLIVAINSNNLEDYHIKYLDIQSSLFDVVVKGNYLFAAGWNLLFAQPKQPAPGLLVVVNISDPENMRVLELFDLPRSTWGIKVHNGYAYVTIGSENELEDAADGVSGLKIIDARAYPTGTGTPKTLTALPEASYDDVSQPAPLSLNELDEATDADIEAIKTISRELSAGTKKVVDNEEYEVLFSPEPAAFMVQPLSSALLEWPFYGAALGDRAVKDLKVYKFFPDRDPELFTKITDKNDLKVEDGFLWFTTAADRQTILDANHVFSDSDYVMWAIVQDNEGYDLDRTEGVIIDPPTILTKASGDPVNPPTTPGSSGSSGGCLMNPDSTFGFEWLLLLLVLFYCRRAMA
jgi:hypothetical protein